MTKFRIGTGCEFHLDCLTCPYPDCLSDKQRLEIKKSGKVKLVKSLKSRGLTTKEIASILKVSKRTVNRYLRR